PSYRRRADDAGGTRRRCRRVAVASGDASAGNDACLHPEDPGHLRRASDRAAVHGRRASRLHDADRRAHHLGWLPRPVVSINLSFLPVLAAVFMLMFARLGTMVMLMPGLGEQGIPVQIRLVIALVLTLLMLPLHRAAYTVDLSKSFAPVVGLLLQELMIGAVLGLTARLALSALQVAGATIAQQLGLGFVTTVDPTQGQQGVLVGNFLAILGVALIFATDLHHLVIAALNDSYRLFQPGASLPTGDIAELMLTTVGGAFRVGVQIAAP